MTFCPLQLKCVHGCVKHVFTKWRAWCGIFFLSSPAAEGIDGDTFGFLLGLAFLSPVFLGFSIAMICIIRYRRKLGFPFNVFAFTRMKCRCRPYCYCVGTQTNADLSGVLTVVPCEECFYSALNCPRPPLELLKTVRLHNEAGVTGHRQVDLFMTHACISAIINEEPGENPNHQA